VQLPGELKFALPLSVPVRLTIEPSGKGVQELVPPAGPVPIVKAGQEPQKGVGSPVVPPTVYVTPAMAMQAQPVLY